MIDQKYQKYNPGIVYLACPYTPKGIDELSVQCSVRISRFKTVTKVCAELSKLGLTVFSPITHSHPMSVLSNMPGTWEFWGAIDEVFLKHSSALFVLKLDGWDRSTGVLAEIAIAETLGLPIVYLDAILEEDTLDEQSKRDSNGAWTAN